jgi:hypothetical protein
MASEGSYSQDHCWVIRVDDDNEAIVEVRDTLIPNAQASYSRTGTGTSSHNSR